MSPQDFSPFDRASLAIRLFAADPVGLGGVVLRGPSGPLRDQLLQLLRDLRPTDTPIRRCPIGADDDRLLGGLDVVAALAHGAARVQPGLLAQADGGVLILPSAERLSAAAAGRITAAIDDGQVRLERDGRSLQWPARFGVVVLDEGEGDERAPAALHERAAFLLDLNDLARPPRPAAHGSRPADAAICEDAVLTAITTAAAALGIVSLRPCLFALRAARGLARLDGRDSLIQADIETAAGLVLSPRAVALPSPDEAPDPPPPDPPDADPQDAPPENQAQLPPEVLEDLIVAAARAAIPDQLLAALAAGAIRAKAGGQGAASASLHRGRPIGVRAGLPRNGARLALLATLRAAAPWQTIRRAQHREGPPVRLTREDLRIRRFAERSEASVIFIVDASGSAAFQRLAEVKGAIELILAEAYAARTHVALVVFRKDGAQVLAPPTRSLARARALLAGLPGGGATPLAAGLEAGLALAIAERGKGRSVLTLLLSDGRANIARDGSRDRARAAADAVAAATRFRVAGIATIVVDTGRWPGPENQALATAMGARCVALPFADAAAMKALIPT
jgi:magnesium chelatase subunit D